MLFILIAIVSTIYLALALALCVLVLFAVYWAATKLIEMLGHESDPPGSASPRDPATRRRPR